MQRKVNQTIFAILAMLTIWVTVHTSKIGSMQPDVKVLNKTVNSMMNRLIELEANAVVKEIRKEKPTNPIKKFFHIH